MTCAVLIALMMGLGGCATSTSTRDLNAEGVYTHDTGQDAAYLTEGGYAISTEGFPGFINATPEGIEERGYSSKRIGYDNTFYTLAEAGTAH